MWRRDTSCNRHQGRSTRRRPHSTSGQGQRLTGLRCAGGTVAEAEKRCRQERDRQGERESEKREVRWPSPAGLTSSEGQRHRARARSGIADPNVERRSAAAVQQLAAAFPRGSYAHSLDRGSTAAVEPCARTSLRMLRIRRCRAPLAWHNEGSAAQQSLTVGLLRAQQASPATVCTALHIAALHRAGGREQLRTPHRPDSAVRICSARFPLSLVPLSRALDLRARAAIASLFRTHRLARGAALTGSTSRRAQAAIL